MLNIGSLKSFKNNIELMHLQHTTFKMRKIAHYAITPFSTMFLKIVCCRGALESVCFWDREYVLIMRPMYTSFCGGDTYHFIIEPHSGFELVTNVHSVN